MGVVDIEAALKLELSAHGGRLDKRLVTCLVTFRTKNKGLHRCKPLFSNGAGTRRTVCFGKARFFEHLEFAGKFGVPQQVTINKSAIYGARWNRIRDFLDVSPLSVCK